MLQTFTDVNRKFVNVCKHLLTSVNICKRARTDRNGPNTQNKQKQVKTRKNVQTCQHTHNFVACLRVLCKPCYLVMYVSNFVFATKSFSDFTYFSRTGAHRPCICGWCCASIKWRVRALTSKCVRSHFECPRCVTQN